MKNYVQDGNTITLTAPTAGVKSGALILLGAVTTGFGVIAKSDAAAAEEYEAQSGGVVELEAEAGTGKDIAAGALVSYVIATGKVSKDAAATGKHRLGRAWRAKSAAGLTVLVKLFDH